jgi:GTP-binding protein
MMLKKAEFVASYNDARNIPSDGRPQIAFAGRSNVGKSTLLNKLAGRKNLARTSKIPGRTQVINFFLINDSFFFVDLPGYGYAKAPEKARKEWSVLVDDYLENSPGLKGLIFLLDSRREPGEDERMMVDWIGARNVRFVLVLTKADKLGRGNLNKKMREIEQVFKTRPIPFSSRSGVGKKELIRWIEETIRD